MQQLDQTLACLLSFTGTTESTSEKVRAVVYDAVRLVWCRTEERKQEWNTRSPLLLFSIYSK